jgi:hypothetical protein
MLSILDDLMRLLYLLWLVLNEGGQLRLFSLFLLFQLLLLLSSVQ